MDTLKSKYGKYFAEMTKHSHAAAKIDETCVFQEANWETRKYMDILLKDNVLRVQGLEMYRTLKHFTMQ